MSGILPHAADPKRLGLVLPSYGYHLTGPPVRLVTSAGLACDDLAAAQQRPPAALCQRKGSRASVLWTPAWTTGLDGRIHSTSRNMIWNGRVHKRRAIRISALLKYRYRTRYLYKVASGQICRSRDQLGSPAGVPVRQMAGPTPLKGPNNILELR